jgi:hypothetical protein
LLVVAGTNGVVALGAEKKEGRKKKVSKIGEDSREGKSRGSPRRR